MKKRIVSVISWLLAVAMLVSMPVCAFAEDEGDGENNGIFAQSDEQETETPAKVEKITDGVTVSGGVATFSGTLTYSAANAGVGRSEEGYYIGIKVTAPSTVTDANVGNVKYRVNGGAEKSFADHQDGNYYITLWGLVKNEFLKVGKTFTYTWEFDWEGDGTYDFKAIIQVDPTKVTLGAPDSSHQHAKVEFDKVHETDTTPGREAGWYCKVCSVTEGLAVIPSKGTKDTSVKTPAAVVTTADSVKYYVSFVDRVVEGNLAKNKSLVVKEVWKYDGKQWGLVSVDDKSFWLDMADVKITDESVSSGGSTGSSGGIATGVIANTNTVNIRNVPTTIGSNVVGSLKRGTEVTIFERVQHHTTKKWWARIGEDEWVCMDYITVTSGSVDTSEEPEPEETGKPKSKGIVVNCTNLNVRSTPSASGKLVGRIANGTEVSIYETDTTHGVEWGRIGIEKWVCLQYIRITDENPGASDSDEDGDDTTVDETPIATGTVTSNMNLKVRTGAGTNFPIKTSLVKGSKISIYATKTVNGSPWGRIGKDQWVCLSYVNIDSGSISDGNTDSASSTANATIVNCSKSVNVRADTSASSALVAQIGVNTRVYISQIKKAANGTKWGKVDNGWVCMDYVKMDDDAGVSDGNSTVSTTIGAPYANITVPAVTKDGATVRLNADFTKENKTLLVLGQGIEINIVGRALAYDEQWGKVSLNGVTGWVLMNEVELKNISTTVSTAQTTAYDKPSTDGKEVVVWGKGQALTITEQETDGTYLWGRVKGNAERWVNMANLALKTGSGSDNTPAATISIIGKVADETSLPVKDDKGNTLLTLQSGTKIEVTDLKNEGGTCYGRVTINNVAVKPVTGWVNMVGVKQTAVTGKVSADVVTLYRTMNGNPSSLTLKKNNSVTILERIMDNTEDKAVWGKLKINNVFYWIKMKNVDLNGTGATGNVGNTGSTGNTGATGNAGNIGATGTEAPAGTTNVPGVVKSTYVNVRSEASAKSKLVTKLNQGTKVTVYEQTFTDGAAWGKIDQGWVAMEYIDLSSRPTTGSTVSNTTIMTSVPSGAVGVGFVNYDGLTIRSGAGLGFGKVGSLKKGTNVVITEQKLSGGMIWGKIDKGWICTSYVTMTGAGISGSGSTGTIARCAYTVNVRNNPGVGSALVAKLLVNSRVEILDTQIYSGEQWGRTSLGWISMQYVLMDN